MAGTQKIAVSADLLAWMLSRYNEVTRHAVLRKMGEELGPAIPAALAARVADEEHETARSFWAAVRARPGFHESDPDYQRFLAADRTRVRGRRTA